MAGSTGSYMLHFIVVKTWLNLVPGQKQQNIVLRPQSLQQTRDLTFDIFPLNFKTVHRVLYHTILFLVPFDQWNILALHFYQAHFSNSFVLHKKQRYVNFFRHSSRPCKKQNKTKRKQTQNNQKTENEAKMKVTMIIIGISYITCLASLPL